MGNHFMQQRLLEKSEKSNGDFASAELAPGSTTGERNAWGREALKERLHADYEGAGTAALAAVMDVLANDPEGSDLELALTQLAAIRSVPYESIAGHWQIYTERAAWADKMVEVGEAHEVPDLDQERHAEFQGSLAQMRHGSYVGEVLGMDPVFGALLNPTGGLVGPGNASYQAGPSSPDSFHGEAHDAFGYLKNYHDKGPGYTYVDDDPNALGRNPLTGQASGFQEWNEIFIEEGRDKAGETPDQMAHAARRLLETSLLGGADSERQPDDGPRPFKDVAAKGIGRGMEVAGNLVESGDKLRTKHSPRRWESELVGVGKRGNLREKWEE